MSSIRSRMRRQRDREYRQTIIKVFAEAPFVDRPGQVHIGRRDHPDVRLYNVLTPDPRQLAVLQHPQQLDLRLQRHLADLVQEQRAAVGLFKAALPLRAGVGKGALFVAEKLGFEQRLGDGAAVYFYIRFIFAARIVMDEVREQLLARPGFALYQYGRIGIGHIQRQLDRPADGRRLADDLALPLVQLALEPHHLGRELVALQGGADLVGDPLDERGLMLGENAVALLAPNEPEDTESLVRRRLPA